MVWDYTYIGRRIDAYNEYQYILKTRAVENVNAANAFDYSIQPLSLTVIRRQIRSSPSALKQASVQSAAAARQQQQSYEYYEQQKLLEASIGYRITIYVWPLYP
jgi:hypothetical protein